MAKQVVAGAKNALNQGINLLSIAKAIVISYIITIPTFIVFAIILTYTDFPEKYITPVVVITTIISILIAGSMVTRTAKSKGWLNGGIVGFAYILVLYLASGIVFNNFAIDKYVLTMTVIGVLTGSIGGILGINIKFHAHAKLKRKKSYSAYSSKKR